MTNLTTRAGRTTLFLAALLFLVPTPTDAHPGHYGLVSIAQIKRAERKPLTAEDKKDLASRIEGAWKLTGYRLWNQEFYMEVPSTKPGTKESWQFRPTGQFRHVMDDKLWFSGRWQIGDGLWRVANSDEGTSRGYFYIKLTNVSTSLNTYRQEEYFLATMLDDDRSLALFYLGKDPTDLTALKQAHTFAQTAYSGG